MLSQRLPRFAGGTVCPTSNASSGLPIGPVNSARTPIGQACPRKRTMDAKCASVYEWPLERRARLCYQTRENIVEITDTSKNGERMKNDRRVVSRKEAASRIRVTFFAEFSTQGRAAQPHSVGVALFYHCQKNKHIQYIPACWEHGAQKAKQNQTKKQKKYLACQQKNKIVRILPQQFFPDDRLYCSYVLVLTSKIENRDKRKTPCFVSFEQNTPVWFVRLLLFFVFLCVHGKCFFKRQAKCAAPTRPKPRKQLTSQQWLMKRARFPFRVASTIASASARKR